MDALKSGGWNPLYELWVFREPKTVSVHGLYAVIQSNPKNITFKVATKLYFMHCWHVVIILFSTGLFKSVLSTTLSAANKHWSTVTYRQSTTFDRPYLSCDDQRDRQLFQEIFLCWYYFYFLEIYLNERQLVFLEFKHINAFTKHKEQVCFFLSIYFLLAVS